MSVLQIVTPRLFVVEDGDRISEVTPLIPFSSDHILRLAVNSSSNSVCGRNRVEINFAENAGDDLTLTLIIVLQLISSVTTVASGRAIE